jgi:hypothetical protein
MMNRTPDTTHGPLAQMGKRLRALLADSATGPILAAQVVKEELEPNWDRYRAEANGADLEAWILGINKGGLRFFEVRYRAMQILTKGICAGLHDRAAIRIVNTVSEGDRMRVSHEVRALYKKQGIPVTVSQANRIIYRVTGRVAKETVCAYCEALRAQIRKMGGEPAA